MTGNVALKVANAFARIHQRVSHEVFSLLSHIILTRIYPFLEEYWKANSITCIVAIMVLTDTSDEECTIAKLKTYALECTYCAIRIRSLVLA
jgi:hypothetical protein